MSPSSRTELATGTINGSDRLIVELVEADDMPPIVLVEWPPQPTVCNPDRFPENDKLIWPHCAGLIWPHPGSVNWCWRLLSCFGCWRAGSCWCRFG